MPPPKVRTGLISGASAGIGREAARALAARGYDLLLGGRDRDRLAALVAELGQAWPGGRFLGHPFDVQVPSEIAAAVATMLERLGRIDLLVTSAGVGMMDFLDRLDPETDIVPQIATNLTGTILLARAVLPPMLAQRSGTIVLVGSLAGRVGTPTYSIYAATKFGLMGFAEALRREVAPWGLTVSVLLPGAVATGFAEGSVVRRSTRLRTPASLALRPDRVGRAIADLAERPRPVLVIPWWMRPAIALARGFPWLVDLAARHLFVVPERLSRRGPD